jgi:hypothetical protein
MTESVEAIAMELQGFVIWLELAYASHEISARARNEKGRQDLCRIQEMGNNPGL